MENARAATCGAAQPVKAQQQPEHKAQHEPAKPGGNQPKPSVRIDPSLAG